MVKACRLCKGACCEALILPLKGVLTPDAYKWFAFHGQETDIGVQLHCRCSKLGNRGECTVYEDRPQVCQEFKVGSRECMRALSTRRTANFSKIVKAMAEENIHPWNQSDELEYRRKKLEEKYKAGDQKNLRSGVRGATENQSPQ